MSKILKMSDRISLKIGKVTFKLAPLSYVQKLDLTSCTRTISGSDHFDLQKAQALYIKYSLKEVKGLTGYNDEPYELSFEGDNLTDDCVSEILNIQEREKLTISAWQLLDGLKELTDPISGKKLTGVKLEIISGK